MKRLLIASLMAGLVLCACKNGDHSSSNVLVTDPSPTDSSKFTEITWLDSTVNFGTVNMGEKVQVAFKFRNTGNKPLYLNNVRAGCGCTVPDYTKGAIAPGQTGMVTGAFDTNKSHPGEVHKNIFVNTNTKDGMNHTLTFTGTIKEAPVK